MRRRGKDHARQVLQIDLVADAHSRRHGGEIAECRLAPFEKGVALPVALELQRGVDGIRIRSAEFVHLDRVVDHQLRRLQRVDLLRVAAQLLHGVAHGRQIDNGGHAGKVLHQHARRHKRDLARRLRICLPLGQELDVVRGHALAIFLPQQVFQQYAQAIRKTAKREAFGLQRIETEDFVALVADLQGGLAAEAVHGDSSLMCPSRSARRFAQAREPIKLASVVRDLADDRVRRMAPSTVRLAVTETLVQGIAKSAPGVHGPPNIVNHFPHGLHQRGLTLNPQEHHVSGQ